MSVDNADVTKVEENNNKIFICGTTTTETSDYVDETDDSDNNAIGESDDDSGQDNVIGAFMNSTSQEV